MATPSPSLWRIPLVREIAVILVIKLAILLTIKAIWFDAPTVPKNGTALVSEHLFRPATTRLKPDEESPR
ncbi:cytochrome oxidase putative small subunit CydP [Pseudomonas sp. Marseille-QA0892]